MFDLLWMFLSPGEGGSGAGEDHGESSDSSGEDNSRNGDSEEEASHRGGDKSGKAGGDQSGKGSGERPGSSSDSFDAARVKSTAAYYRENPEARKALMNELSSNQEASALEEIKAVKLELSIERSINRYKLDPETDIDLITDSDPARVEARAKALRNRYDLMKSKDQEGSGRGAREGEGIPAIETSVRSTGGESIESLEKKLRG